MFTIINPKQGRRELKDRDGWFPYYAGFSSEFANAIIGSSILKRDAVVFDPWNGAGTTTAAAQKSGYTTIGFDVNPVMVLVAKARCLRCVEIPNILPLTHSIIDSEPEPKIDIKNDPLLCWLAAETVKAIRNLQFKINKVVLKSQSAKINDGNLTVNKFSGVGAFYYIVLFRVVRGILAEFVPSNPTWTKRPRDPSVCVSVAEDVIVQAFLLTIESMLKGLELCAEVSCEEPRLELADSSKLPLANESVDMVLSSPPYCTRIDYAVATMIELAVLGFDLDCDFQDFRRNVIGNSKVPKIAPDLNPAWGATCVEFLSNLKKHPSKASATYYYKNHAQYFNSIFLSISEIARVLKFGGKCVLVVQDSYYKDIYNDLAKIIIEMFSAFGVNCSSGTSFTSKTVMAGMHPHRAKYRSSVKATESILCFQKL